MLLDKSIHINALNSKLRNYEEGIKELLEYRQLKNDVYKKEFQQCENKDHTKSLLLMQNDLQNYRRTIEDKNQQILVLNSTNRDLLEKMEEMLSQTRNDIEKFSHKYNLPQLEKMTEDLKEAEDKIKDLEEKLKRSEERRVSLVHKFQKSDKNLEKDLRKELDQLKLNNEKERNNFENQVKKLQQELADSSLEIENLKKYADDLVSENKKLITQLEDHNTKMNLNDPDESLKKQYLEAIQKLHEFQKKVKTLEENVEELTRLKTLSDGEKCTYQFQATDYRNQLQSTQTILETMKEELEASKTALKAKEVMIQDFRNISKNLGNEMSTLKRELASKETDLKIAIDTKNELTELLQNANSEIKASRKEVFRMKNQKVEEMEEQKSPQSNPGDDHAVDILTMEIRLREEIQEDYFKKLKEIENKYKKVCASRDELTKNVRSRISTVVNECSQKIKELEEDRDNLVRQIHILQKEIDDYKIQASSREESIKTMLRAAQHENKENIEKWQSWSKEFVNNCLKIESINKRSRNNIFSKMQTVDSEVAAVEKSYNEKIRKYIKNCKR
ncbi:hypothetical protein JTB14_014106 [Gonioctena quinquepunctata]|nr:hypothetical protein JTB14_014106 [Gonioctena quinquepunctata]